MSKRVTQTEATVAVLTTLGNLLIARGAPQWAVYVKLAAQVLTSKDKVTARLLDIEKQLKMFIREERDPTAIEVLTLGSERYEILAKRRTRKKSVPVKIAKATKETA